MNCRALVSVAVGLVGTGSVLAQSPPNLAEIFKSHDLVCSGVTPEGKLDCAFKVRAGAVVAVAPVTAPPPAAPPDTPPTPSPGASAPAPSPGASVPGTLPAAVPAATAGDPKVFDALASIGKADTSVPESPAFAVLGLTPSEVQRPGSMREFGTSLIRAVDSSGKPKTGVAIDFAPLAIGAPQLIRGGTSYESNPWLQAAARTTVSLATTTAGDGKASKLAWGVRVGVFDRGDPGNHYSFVVECLKDKSMGNIKPGHKKGDVDLAPAPPPNPEELKKCDPTVGLPLWAEPALYVGYGKSWYSETGRFTNDAPAATGWWATYSQGLDRGEGNLRTLFLLHASKMTDDRVEDPDDSTKLLRKDSTKYIGRLRVGKPTWHAFFDLGREKVHLGDATKESLRHTAIGAEYKLSEAIWLQAGLVRQSGFQDGTSKTTVSSGLRFGTEPIFKVK